MVKQTTVTGKETNSANEELLALKSKVSELETANNFLRENNLKTIGDIDQIRERSQKNASTTGHITYKEIRSYIPMSLYHQNGFHIGKKVGPMHPSNAVETAVRFKNIGIILGVNPPSQRRIDEYKQTEEYKALKIEKDKEFAAANRSRKESEIEKLTKQVAKLAGISQSEVVSIKRQDDVR
jgi:hypothetical protein